MGVDDPQDFNRGLENERQRLKDSDDIHEVDRDALRDWLRQKSGTVEVSSLKTYLRRVRVASERSDTPIVEMEEPDYQDLVFTLRHDHDLADSTVMSYESAVLPFIADSTGAEWPENVERTRVEVTGPRKSEMLTPEDIQTLTATARHQRDVAFIEFLADTGARLSLALSLRVKDVDLAKPPTYSPNPNATGLKGAALTDYPLIDSSAAVRSYLRTSHPRPDDGDVALFHKLQPASRSAGDRWGDDDGGLRANAMRQQLVRVADRAGIEKSVKPHAFRHAAITRMAREGYSRSQIEHRVHWSLDTDMWEIYEHITNEQHNEDIFREAGIIDDDRGPDRVRRPCGDCREPLAPHHDFCPNCGSPATADAEELTTDDQSTVLEELVEATNPTTRRELRELLDVIEEHPDLSHDEPS